MLTSELHPTFSWLPSSEKALIPGSALIGQTGVTCPLLNQLLQSGVEETLIGYPGYGEHPLPLSSLLGRERLALGEAPMHMTQRTSLFLFITRFRVFQAGNAGEHSVKAPGTEELAWPREQMVREGFLGEACLQTVKGETGRAWQAEGTAWAKAQGKREPHWGTPGCSV